MFVNRFALIRTVEFDVEVGEDRFALRIELFVSESNPHTFRARAWRTEVYRIQSTFPQEALTGEPKHQPSDEVILIDWSSNIRGEYSTYEAESAAAALEIVIEDIHGTVDRAVGHMTTE
jgi:hypothetical protein